MLIIYPLASEIHGREYYGKVLDEYKSVLTTYKDVKFCNVVTSIKQLESITCGIDDIPVLIFLTGGTSRLGLEIAKKYNRLVVIIAHGEHNSLPSALSCKGKCSILGIPCITLYSNRPREITDMFKKVYNAYSAYSHIRSLRILLIDEKTKTRDAITLENTIKGVSVIPIPPEVIDRELNLVSEEDVNSIVKYLTKTFNISFNQLNSVESTIKYYLVFKKLIKEHKANALTLNCFNFISRRGITPCLPLAILNSEGIPAACEEDYHSLLLLTLSLRLTGKPGWIGNPSAINGDTVVFAHCTIAFSLSKRVQLLPHFETGLPIAISGEVGLGRVLLTRLSYDYKELIVYEGEIVKSGLLSNSRCRTQIHLKLSRLTPQDFIETAKGNHHVIIPSNSVRNELEYTGKLLGLKVVLYK